MSARDAPSFILPILPYLERKEWEQIISIEIRDSERKEREKKRRKKIKIEDRENYTNNTDRSQ